MRPSAAVSGRDLTSVELPGDGIAACVAGGLNLANDRQDIGRKPCRIRHTGRAHALGCASGVTRSAQLRSARLSGCQGRLRALRNSLPLVLGHGRQDVDRQGRSGLGLEAQQKAVRDYLGWGMGAGGQTGTPLPTRNY
jgi:hypothetical protein